MTPTQRGPSKPPIVPAKSEFHCENCGAPDWASPVLWVIVGICDECRQSIEQHPSARNRTILALG